jgi:hypothetical protein
MQGSNRGIYNRRYGFIWTNGLEQSSSHIARQVAEVRGDFAACVVTHAPRGVCLPLYAWFRRMIQSELKVAAWLTVDKSLLRSKPLIRQGEADHTSHRTRL